MAVKRAERLILADEFKRVRECNLRRRALSLALYEGVKEGSLDKAMIASNSKSPSS